MTTKSREGMTKQNAHHGGKDGSVAYDEFGKNHAEESYKKQKRGK